MAIKLYVITFVDVLESCKNRFVQLFHGTWIRSSDLIFPLRTYFLNRIKLMRILWKNQIVSVINKQFTNSTLCISRFSIIIVEFTTFKSFNFSNIFSVNGMNMQPLYDLSNTVKLHFYTLLRMFFRSNGRYIFSRRSSNQTSTVQGPNRIICSYSKYQISIFKSLFHYFRCISGRWYQIHTFEDVMKI